MGLSLQWLAGFFDGEGYLGFGYTGKDAKNFYVRMAVSNTHLPTLQAIQNEFGGSICPKVKGKPNWRQGYQLTWSCSEARVLLALLVPFLVTKKEQANLLLESWSPVSGWRTDPIERERRVQVASQLAEMKRIEYPSVKENSVGIIS